jgi:hypothetical protein
MWESDCLFTCLPGSLHHPVLAAPAHATLLSVMPERSFIILKYVGKVPSLASYAKYQRRFFTPNTYSKDWIRAEEYLREKFDLHQCPQEDEPKQTSTVHRALRRQKRPDRWARASLCDVNRQRLCSVAGKFTPETAKWRGSAMKYKLCTLLVFLALPAVAAAPRTVVNT